MGRTHGYTSWVAAVAVALSTTFTIAQGEELHELDFSSLMHMPVTVAARFEQSQEEAPSIVSVVTRQEIVTYGARDLADILRMIPGFEFGVDVAGIVGLGYRGVWAHEGKVLVMVDGMTMNDLGFGNNNFFGSFPSSIIERVEIIRGPGSALYGTFAQVGVINIVTRSGADLQGLSSRLTLGATESSTTYDGDVAWGQKSGNFDVAAEVGFSRAPLTDRTYVGFSGAEAQGGLGNSQRKWQHMLIRAQYKEALKFQYARMRFENVAQSAYGDPPLVIDGRNTGEFLTQSEVARISYEAKPARHWTLEPLAELIVAPPIAMPLNPAFPGALFGELRRYKGEVISTYEHEKTESVPFAGKVTLGLGASRDEADSFAQDGTPGLQRSDGTPIFKRSTQSRYVYGQYITGLKHFGLTLGTRYESSDFGDSLAPRAGITYADSRFNAKLLFGKAFRVPMPFQAFANQFTLPPGGLKPETSKTWDLELGYRWSNSFLTRINAFTARIDRPITYDGAANGYFNEGFLRSRGLEAEARYEQANWGTFLNLAYVTSGADTSPGYLAANGDDFIGLPSGKLNWGAHATIGAFSLAPSITVLSKRYGQTADATPGLTQSYPSLTMLNMAVNWRATNGRTTLSLTAHNLLNEHYVLLQPYYGGHAPLPAQDREVRLTVDFQLR